MSLALTDLMSLVSDEDFQSFLESLKENPNKAFDVDTLETLGMPMNNFPVAVC